MTLTPHAINAASPAEALLLSVEKVARLLGGVSVRTVERMVRRNQFPPPRKLGRRTLWPRALVERWVNDPDAVTAILATPVEAAPVAATMLRTARTPAEESAGPARGLRSVSAVWAATMGHPGYRVTNTLAADAAFAYDVLAEDDATAVRHVHRSSRRRHRPATGPRPPSPQAIPRWNGTSVWVLSRWARTPP